MEQPHTVIVKLLYCDLVPYHTHGLLLAHLMLLIE